MQTSLLIAGFGGQGILVTGQVIATACMLDGKKVTYMPAYGAEVRGGTVHVTIVMSDHRISSPYVPNPDAAVVMNRPSLDRFEPLLQSNGLLVCNTSLIDRAPRREDLRVVQLAANDISNELGNPRVIGLVALGAYVAASEVTTLDALLEALRRVLPPERHGLIPINKQALERGMACFRDVAAGVS